MFFFYTDMIKPVWKTIKTPEGFNLKFPETMRLRDGLVAKFDEARQRISISDARCELGEDRLVWTKDRIKCEGMEVVPYGRERGIGGLMHAIAVMLMKENKAKNIYLDSLAKAVRFHFHKGFKTDNVEPANAVGCMKSIIASKTVGFDDLKKRASSLLYDLSLGGKEAVEKADRLYDEFIRRVLKTGVSVEDAKFPNTVCMDLDMKDVKKNRELYNGILKDFGIDYTI